MTTFERSRFTVNRETELKIEKLLAQMTLEEKIGQMTQRGSLKETELQWIREGKIGSLLNVRGADNINKLQRIAVEESRLGIPLLIGDDVIHGYRTIFPIPLAESCSWNPGLIEETAAIAAREASAEGIHWIFAPMVDIARDARWGRIAEGAGEDPFLGSVIAAARVRGFQRNDWNDRPPVAACPKHFAAYGAAQAGRDYHTVDVSEITLRETYFPPFQAALEAGAGTVMSAFNDLNGVPCTGNEWLLTGILQREWGFQGFVVSDWESIDELVQHGLAASRAEAAAVAVRAGAHMDMHAKVYHEHLAELVRSGIVPEKFVDDAVRRILRVKFWLGLFDQPYTSRDAAERVILHPKHRETAREMARQSIVLLKNDGALLPLSKHVRSIAVIGPLADADSDMMGCWAGQGRAEDVVTVLDGIREKLGIGGSAAQSQSQGESAFLVYARGCGVMDDSAAGFAEAVQAARNAEVAVLVLGESAGMSGENNSRASLDLPGVQLELLKQVHATGTPVVLLLASGRPLSVPWAAEHVPAILQIWQPGIEAGHAVADVLFGDCNPSGKLTVTIPRTVGQVPISYADKRTGRPGMKRYADSDAAPLYPFGYGRSYTRFEYSDIRISAPAMKPDGSVTVSARVTNVGGREGVEIVQLYVGDAAASVTRPEKLLKGFRRLSLQAGESKEVSFAVTAKELGFINRRHQFVVEPGLFRLWIGPDSATGLAAELLVTEN